MELVEGGPYVNPAYHRFLPYRHFSVSNMWLVLHFRDEYSETWNEAKGEMKTIEERWNVIAETPLNAALAAQKNYQRDRDLKIKYRKETEKQFSLFRDLRMIDQDNLKDFQEICKPLMDELGKRKHDLNRVSEVGFLTHTMDVIKRFNTVALEMQETILNERKKYKELVEDGNKKKEEVSKEASKKTNSLSNLQEDTTD